MTPLGFTFAAQAAPAGVATLRAGALSILAYAPNTPAGQPISAPERAAALLDLQRQNVSLVPLAPNSTLSLGQAQAFAGRHQQQILSALTALEGLEQYILSWRAEAPERGGRKTGRAWLEARARFQEAARGAQERIEACVEHQLGGVKGADWTLGAHRLDLLVPYAGGRAIAQNVAEAASALLARRCTVIGPWPPLSFCRLGGGA